MPARWIRHEARPARAVPAAPPDHGPRIAPFRPIDGRSGRFCGAGLAQQTRGSPSHHPDCALLNPNLRTKAMTAALSPVVVLSSPRRECAVGLLAVSVETMRLRIGFARFRECNQHNRDVTASTSTNRRVTDQACTTPRVPGRSGMAGGKRNSPCAAFHVSKPAPRVCGRDTRRTHGCLSAPHTTTDDGLAFACPGKSFAPISTPSPSSSSVAFAPRRFPGHSNRLITARLGFLWTLRHG